MSPEQLLRAEALARHALSLDAASRRDLLDRECGDDAALRAEVEFQLRMQAETQHRLAGDGGASSASAGPRPADAAKWPTATALDANLSAPRSEASAANDAVSPHDPTRARADEPRPVSPLSAARAGRPPERIGPYRILEKLGQGGFGVVYLAEQQQPVRRQVALKVVRPGMDSHEVIARFEAERQALALMDHPGIAKIFDAGTTEAGRPYFAMEYVQGVPLNDYCDRNQLDTRERLELFIQVCDAVQHAHFTGILHRDLKPSNILVMLQDGKPRAKVIDFGIAKALHQPLTEQTLHTQQGQLIGTPEYMSPEQAEMSGLNVDTRTDVYSLGVVLYQLLTGTLPFESGTLRSGDLAQLQRTIREQEPVRPSARVATRGADVAEIGRRRRTDPQTLWRQLRGDLDWITLRTMEKDRARRYPSASELAADIGRYLRNEPILARPPSATYRGRKFVQRHRPLVVGAAATLVALVLGLVGTSVGLSRAKSALVRAREAEALAIRRAEEADAARRQTDAEKRKAEQQRQRAQAEAEKARAVTNFLTTGLLYRLEPGRGGAPEITMREALDQAAARVGPDFATQPAIEAALQSAIGSMYDSLGHYSEAEKHLRRAIQRAVDAGADARMERIVGLTNLCVTLQHQGRSAEAVAASQEALKLWRAVPAEGAQRLFEAALLENLAGAQFEAGKPEAALKNAEAAIRLRREWVSVKDRGLAESLSGLSKLLERAGDVHGSEHAARESLAIFESIGEGESYGAALAMEHLAGACIAQGRYADAESPCRRGLELLRNVHVRPHVNVAKALSRLVEVLYYTGRLAEAETHIRAAVAIQEAVLPPDHPSLGQSLTTLALILSGQGRANEAEAPARRAVEITIRYADVRPEAHANTLENLAEVREAQGHADDALRLLQESLDIRRQKIGNEDFSYSITLGNLGRLLCQLGRAADAEPLLRDCLRIRERTAPFHWGVAAARGRLGDALARLDRFKEAEPLLREAYRALEDNSGVNVDWKQDILSSLVRTCEALKKPKAAQRYRQMLNVLNASTSRPTTTHAATSAPTE